jgi:hypothetical protein
MRKLHLNIALFSVAVTLSCGAVGGGPSERVFECSNLFTPGLSASDLENKFGAQHVVTTEIYLGEGFYETGTVLYPDSPSDRVEILWHDKEA